MRCLGCCVRLVLSTHPDRRQAACMLAAISAAEGAPHRRDVLVAVAAALAHNKG